jgi:hypothetical protein
MAKIIPGMPFGKAHNLFGWAVEMRIPCCFKILQKKKTKMGTFF